MKGNSIVVIEDEPDILDVIQYNLVREGYDVFASTNGEEGLALIKREKPAMVLLDLMLPGKDGLEICRELKKDERTKTIPVVMVTAKGEESDVVLGLGIGADDYVTKPFSPRELMARVKAVMRRSRNGADTEASPERIQRDGLVIDKARYEVTVDGESISLTSTEFRLLYFLATHPSRVYTRDQLLNRVVGEDVIVIDRNIDVHVRSIRKKLGPYRDLIKTVRGVGYRFLDEGEAP